MKKSLLYIFMFVLTMLATSYAALALAVFVPSLNGMLETGGLRPQWQLVATLVYSIIIIILFHKTGWAMTDRTYLDKRPFAAAAWSIVAAIGVVVPSLWMQEHLPQLPNIIEDEMSSLLMIPGAYFVIAVVVPLSEEMVFRGAVLGSLLKEHPSRPWTMIALSAVLFALIHFNPAQMPHAFIIGLLLGWMRYRSGSILPSTLFHIANNTCAYLLFRAYPDPDMKLSDIFSGDERAVGAAVLFSMLILLPSLYQLRYVLKK